MVYVFESRHGDRIELSYPIGTAPSIVRFGGRKYRKIITGVRIFIRDADKAVNEIERAAKSYDEEGALFDVNRMSGKCMADMVMEGAETMDMDGTVDAMARGGYDTSKIGKVARDEPLKPEAISPKDEEAAIVSDFLSTM